MLGQAFDIHTVGQLLRHYPRRYIDRSTTVPIREVRFNQQVTVIGRVARVASRRTRRGQTMVTVTVFDGSGYLDLALNFEVAEKTTLTLHAGRQWVRNYSEFNYTDYKIGVARDFGFAALGLAVIGTNADKDLYTVSDGAGRTKKVGETTAVVSISKTF